MKLLALALATILAIAAPAGARPFTEEGGETFDLSLNTNGAVLKNRDQTIYLGRDCDTLVPGFADGRWYEEGGKTFVIVRTLVFIFPGQSPVIPGVQCSR